MHAAYWHFATRGKGRPPCIYRLRRPVSLAGLGDTSCSRSFALCLREGARGNAAPCSHDSASDRTARTSHRFTGTQQPGRHPRHGSCFAPAAAMLTSIFGQWNHERHKIGAIQGTGYRRPPATAGPAARAVRHGDLRRQRRPHAAPAGARAVQPGAHRAHPRALRHHRRRHHRTQRRGLAQQPARRCCRASSATRAARTASTRSTMRRGSVSPAACPMCRATSAISGLFEKLKQHLADVARDRQTGGNCLFYLAVADRFFGPLVEQLGHAGLLDEELQRWQAAALAARGDREAVRPQPRLGA